MKNICKNLLAVCLLVALTASFSVLAFAEEDVTVGQRYEWNAQDGTPEAMKAWGTGGGVSPDGNWKYQIFVHGKKMYIPVVHSPDTFGYAWATKPGDTGLGYARVRDFGKSFHPGETADIVKTFTCPSGGNITVDVDICRGSNWTEGSSGTPTSLAIYLEDQLVWPTSGDYGVISSSEKEIISFDLSVAKGQRLYFRIGCIDGNYGADTVYMNNYVTYKSVNDSVFEEETTATTDKVSVPTKDFTVTLKTDGGAYVENNDQDSGVVTTDTDQVADGSDSNGVLIVGVIVGVAVVAAVAVVVFLKKKK